MVNDYLEGARWRVNIPLTTSMDDDIVIPEPFLRQPANIGNQSISTRMGLVVLGVAYQFEASGTATFALVAHDHPWITHEALVDDPLWQHNVTDAGYYQKTIDNCHWPLAPGGRRYGAGATPDDADGAILKVTTSATNIQDGFLSIWGIHTSNPYGVKAESGSPTTF